MEYAPCYSSAFFVTSRLASLDANASLEQPSNSSVCLTAETISEGSSTRRSATGAARDEGSYTNFANDAGKKLHWTSQVIAVIINYADCSPLATYDIQAIASSGGRRRAGPGCSATRP